MPRHAKGSARRRGETWFARVTVDTGRRQEFALPTCGADDDEKAQKRAELLTELAGKLRDAGQVEFAQSLLECAATRDGQALADVIEATNRLCIHGAVSLSAGVTLRAFGEQWTSGELHRRWPDHVKQKASVQDDRERLESYVYPAIGDVPVAAVGLDHAHSVMARLPARLSRSTRRQVAQALSRLLSLAAYPARLISSSPLPKGFVPQPAKQKALSYLYPDEDRGLLACRDVPLARRVFYGFAAREGMRLSEATGLTWADVDLVRGAVRLDDNKTNDRRMWALDPAVVRALTQWRAVLGDPKDEELVFGTADMDAGHAVTRFRRDLRSAGIGRVELFEPSDNRQPIRLHDLRATFITVSLANDRTETWVADRTGHKSSAMINRYRRSARQFVELGAGPLAPLDLAIPEFDDVAGQVAGQGRSDDKAEKRNDPPEVGHFNVVAEAGLEPALPKKADFESERGVANGRILQDPSGIGSVDATKCDAPTHSAPSPEGSAPLPLDPRAALVRDLCLRLADAVITGDVTTAMVAHRALGDLLSQAGNTAAVVDLESRRRR